MQLLQQKQQQLIMDFPVAYTCKGPSKSLKIPLASLCPSFPPLGLQFPWQGASPTSSRCAAPASPWTPLVPPPSWHWTRASHFACWKRDVVRQMWDEYPMVSYSILYKSCLVAFKLSSESFKFCKKNHKFCL